jgi:L-alanine-DL-glutamate epimerase-like enolase superfamily enzyme
MKLTVRTFDLHLKHTFTIAHDSRDFQSTLIVELEQDGFKGYGEATSNKYYGFTIDAMKKSIEGIRGLLESIQIEDPETFWEQIEPHLRENPFVLCALDVAANDLFGKMSGQPLYKLWGLNSNLRPLTDYTIGIDTIKNMVSKLKEMPWPIYKIKLGTEDDLAIVKELRKYTDSVFRVDANCAWNVDETIEFSRQMKPLGVEFIEQPLKAGDVEGMKKVYQYSELPVIADESCILEEDVVQCAGLFHGINIKLVKCGGLTPARRMIKEARDLNLKVMVGCMNESTVGISAIAQLLPMLDYVDMDGPLLIRDDIASGISFDFGKIIYSDENGTGVNLLV